MVSFGSLAALNMFEDPSSNRFEELMDVLHKSIFQIFWPPHNFHVPELDLFKLSLLRFPPSMEWDLDLMLTSQQLSLNAVASLVKTLMTYAAYAQTMLGIADPAVTQTIADGRNALQNVPLRMLLSPPQKRQLVCVKRWREEGKIRHDCRDRGREAARMFQ